MLLLIKCDVSVYSSAKLHTEVCQSFVEERSIDVRNRETKSSGSSFTLVNRVSFSFFFFVGTKPISLLALLELYFKFL